ncbi:MAG: glutamate--tRNA ligase [Chloroflexi bacterium]|nr:glutamate--tRNA ligase [Chloroflexota bacterium]
MNDLEDGRPVRVRIAPSPTGNCHVGTARNALYNLLYARQRGGAFVLRIDDTDVKRSTEESERGVLEGLRWLGLQWDEGPDIGGAFGPYRQSERQELYHAAVQTLLERGRAYYCFCSPDELADERRRARAEGRPYQYSGKCRYLSPAQVQERLRAGERATVRLTIEPGPMTYVDMVQGPIEQDAALLGDPIILRPNGMPTYNLATVVNEQVMRITHVLRSAEHIANTFAQLQLYGALGYEPPAFAHFGLLLNPDRSKISKRTGAVFIGEFRDMGYTPEAMVNHLALSGWSPGTEQEIFSLDDLIDSFSLERCSKSNAIYDRNKLEWLNGYYIRQLDVAELTRRVVPFLERAGLLASPPSDAAGMAWLTRIVALEQERLKTLADAPASLEFFFREPDPGACLELLRANRFARKHSPAELGAALASALAALRGIEADGWSAEHLEQVLDAETARLGWKRAELLMPLRIAVSGREATPPLFDTLACLGQPATLRRLAAVVGMLE